MLLGSFGYKGRLGPMNVVISNNVIRRSRQVLAHLHNRM